jgi:hypothetical protein
MIKSVFIVIISRLMKVIHIQLSYKGGKIIMFKVAR